MAFLLTAPQDKAAEHPCGAVVSACEGINVRWPSVSRGVVDGTPLPITVLAACADVGLLGWAYGETL